MQILFLFRHTSSICSSFFFQKVCAQRNGFSLGRLPLRRAPPVLYPEVRKSNNNEEFHPLNNIYHSYMFASYIHSAKEKTNSQKKQPNCPDSPNSPNSPNSPPDSASL